MTPYERRLQVVLVGVVLLHAVAVFAFPGLLWGASHLSVWPTLAGASVVGLALVALLLTPQISRRFSPPPGFPEGRTVWLLAAAAGLVFVALHERQHFFGDGSLLIRSRGMSLTVFRGPVMVRAIAWIVSALEDQLGISIEAGFRAISVLAGFVAVVLVFKACRTLGQTSTQRWILLLAFAGSGAWQLFFGHVEYYPFLAAAVVAYLVLVLTVLQRASCEASAERRAGSGTWLTWVVYAVLPTLHLSTLSLAPAQVYVGIRGWKTEPRWISVAGPVVAAILFWTLSRLGNTGAGDLVAETSKGIRAYWALYSDPESTRYAFGFFSWAHALAVFNDLVLLAPMALVAVVMGFRNRAASSPAATFLAVAALGCVLENVLFNREIGPYRDWDALAPYAFVTLAWAGLQLAAERDRAKNTAIWMLGVSALLHTVPWTLLNANAVAAERHVRIVLAEPSMWSPYARGYMYEEFAILARDRGDLQEALREYRAAADASPKDPRYRLGAADMAFLIGDLGAAEHGYREALARRPDFHAAHNNLALLLLRRGDLAGARSHAFEAIRAEPNRLEGYLTLGDIEMAAGDTEAAAAAWRRAHSLSPDAPAVQARMQRLPG